MRKFFISVCVSCFLFSPLAIARSITSWFSLSGELETEFIHSQSDTNHVTNTNSVTYDNNNVARFQVDRLMLKPQFTFDSFFIEGELEFLGGSTTLKEGYGVLNFPQGLFLKAGLDDRFFINPETRKTEIYPLNGTAFWRDEDVGATFGGNHPVHNSLWYWRVSATNGLALREQAPGKNDVYFLLHDDRQINDLTKGDKEYGAGFGYQYKNEKEKAFFDLSAFGFWSKLRINMTASQTVTDVDFLQEVITGYTSNNRDNWLGGGQFGLELDWFSLFSQYILSRDGEVTRQGYYFQPSVQWNNSQKKYFSGAEILYRYNNLIVKTKGLARNIAASAFTWDRETHSVALNIFVTKGAVWRNEYHVNLEETGGNPSSIDNDEFLSQLEIRF